jgi:uncharacterized protein YdhG (YjbR/CyaY superfamily)
MAANAIARPKAKAKSKTKAMTSGKSKSKATGATIDEYLAKLAAPQRAALESLRRTIKSTAPQAEECISYGVPAFRQGRMLVGFGATANHCSFFLMSGNTVAQHAEKLARYDTSKGTVRFTPEKQLPAALVRKLVKARLAENAEK